MRELIVGAPRASAACGVHRVEALVDGVPVWFESRDRPLEPSAEAFLSLLLVPALVHGRRLRTEASVDPRWLAGVERIVAVFAEWWGLPRLAPLARTAAPPPRNPLGRTALCFSGGADSLHALLRGGEPIHLLAYIDGFEAALADEARARAERSMRATAAATAAEPLGLRTNAREHPVLAGVDWRRGHGGMLAATGHLLADRVDRLVIASSIARADDRPWGSHWRIDHLWSSARLEVVHQGAELWRSEKVRRLATEPVAQQHMEVCWFPPVGATNCSRCEKCVRTMLALSGTGHLPEFAVFDHGLALPDRVAALDPLPPRLFGVYAKIRSLGLEPEVDRAVARLMARSQRRARAMVRARRRRLVRALARRGRRARRRLRRRTRRVARDARRALRRTRRSLGALIGR